MVRPVSMGRKVRLLRESVNASASFLFQFFLPGCFFLLFSLSLLLLCSRRQSPSFFLLKKSKKSFEKKKKNSGKNSPISKRNSSRALCGHPHAGTNNNRFSSRKKDDSTTRFGSFSPPSSFKVVLECGSKKESGSFRITDRSIRRARCWGAAAKEEEEERESRWHSSTHPFRVSSARF